MLDQRTPRAAWVIYIAAASAYFMAVVNRTALGVAGVQASERFGLEATGLAMLSVAQIAAYAALQIPGGRLMDRFGARTVMTAGLAVMALGQTMLAFVHEPALVLLARVLIGAGDAPIFIGATRVVGLWFPPRRAPMMIQVTGLIGQTGQLASAIPVAALLHAAGWSVAFATLGAVTVAVGLVAGFGLRAPTDESAVVVAERMWPALRATTRVAGTRLGFWSHFVTPFGANVLTLLWGVPFFVTAQEKSPAQASLLLTCLTLSAIASGPLIGWYSGRHPFRRSWLVLGSAVLTLAAFAALLAFDTPRPMWQLVVFVIAVGIGGPTSVVGLDLARTFSERHRLGTASGFVNVGGFAATIIGVLAVGAVLQLTSEPGATVYTLDEYRLAFAVLIVPWIAGVIGVLASRRRARADLAAAGVEIPSRRPPRTR
ncbi:MFS transporter [Demequina lignilytica]|uniref:MFS transporter n=1 Tax=Demequina lignilytica TaxID=3051663 RepID=A0AAW7M841_9MICO|nr:MULTISPECIES: MFS transporter [unclassified Demequina]MDN4477546.1 MFS transporter [Demequina sp. SYSU T00039-1]MDN4483591.1 MFS transporter [Demequina sp. SYSU T0a273]MDN4488103.1 MFS transporter [Demequina sp. SYSU T00039]MDN4490544.1 MFS transporter [Demequina sp. SYSU T00068]